MATSNSAIKITELPNIGNNIAASTLIPVVNMAGVPITQKANLQITGNLILAGAGGAQFVPAAVANLAYTVVNSYQPNITRVGNLNINTFRVNGGVNGQYLQTDGTGNLSFVSGGGSGNGVVGGANTQIQFNNTGNFGGSTGLTWNSSTGVLSTLKFSVSSDATIYGDTALTNLNVAGNFTTNNIYTDNYYYANGDPFGGILGITVKDEGTNVVASANTINFVGAGVTTSNVGGVATITINGGNGNADTGNVTFSDQVVIGTGDIYGGSGLFLAPGANSTGNLQYLRVRGGDVDTHIHFDTGNNQYFDQYFGADAKFVKLEANGNVVINADDFAGNGAYWTFSADGTTTFPTLTVDLHNGGNQTAQTLQFGDPTQQAIITGPTPSANVNAQRIIIQGQRGNGAGEGGDVYLWAGDADINGGDIKIYAGDADNASAGGGGYINLAGGDGFVYGGDITLNGGYSANGYGGQISINGGQGQTDGGPAYIQGGYGSVGNGGAVQITGGGSSNGAGSYGNVVLGSASSEWTFDNTGNLTLPGNTFAVNYANGTQVSLGGGGGGAAGNAGDVQINVAGNIGADSTLRYVDNGGEMTLYADYLNAPGIFTSDIYAGDGTPSNITLTTNIGNATWTLDTTGNLSLPEGGSIYSEGFTPSGNPGNTITLNPHGSGSITNQKLLVYPTAGDGDHIHLTSGNLYQTELFLGSDSLFVKLANTGNIIINSDDDAGNTAQWKFGIDGNLTASGNLIIAGNTNVFGTVSALIQPTDDKPLLAISSGANAGVSSIWVEDIGNIGSSNIAAVYTNPIPGSGIVRIAVGQNGGLGPKLWDFNSNGTTIFPGDLIGSGASPAPSINNFNSISSITLSATGNITGGNIIGNGNTLSNVATQTTGNWTLAPGVNTVNLSVPINGTYSIWVRGNIPNGIVTYTATVVVTNTNVPVLGSSYGWYYEAGNSLVLTAIPTQIVGTVNNISNAVVSTTTANVFTFGITNNSGNTAVVDWGYTKL